MGFEIFWQFYNISKEYFYNIFKKFRCCVEGIIFNICHTGRTSIKPECISGLHEFRRTLALRGSRKIYRSKTREKMVENCD